MIRGEVYAINLDSEMERINNFLFAPNGSTL